MGCKKVSTSRIFCVTSGRVLHQVVFVVEELVLYNRRPCVSCSFNNVSRLQRFFRQEYDVMTLVMRQVDFPVAT